MKKLIAAVAIAMSLSGCVTSAPDFKYEEVNCVGIYKEGTFPFNEHAMPIFAVQQSYGEKFVWVESTFAIKLKRSQQSPKLFKEIQCEYLPEWF